MDRTWSIYLVVAVACAAPSVPEASTGGSGTPDGGALGRGTQDGGSLGSTPGSTPGQFTLSSVVSESTPEGSRPIGAAGVNAFVQKGGFGYSYWWAHGPTFSDSAGQFRLTGIAESAAVQLQVWKEGYVQQCASPPITMLRDSQLNAELVSRSTLSASPESIPPPAPGFRNVSGRILEDIGAGTGPVADSFVDFEPMVDFPAATTFSDGTGRYLLCGLPDDRTVDLCAGSPGRAACVSVPAGQSTGVDLVLPAVVGP